MRSIPKIDGAVAPMFGRLADVLDRLGPTVLLVDDGHLADAASLDVLHSLVACRGAVRSLCIVVARRPIPPGADSQPAVHYVVDLAPLTEVEVETLGVPGAWVETGGHPASLAACLNASRRCGSSMAKPCEAVLANRRRGR